MIRPAPPKTGRKTGNGEGGGYSWEWGVGGGGGVNKMGAIGQNAGGGIEVILYEEFGAISST